MFHQIVGEELPVIAVNLTVKEVRLEAVLVRRGADTGDHRPSRQVEGDVDTPFAECGNEVVEAVEIAFVQHLLQLRDGLRNRDILLGVFAVFRHDIPAHEKPFRNMDAHQVVAAAQHRVGKAVHFRFVPLVILRPPHAADAPVEGEKAHRLLLPLFERGPPVLTDDKPPELPSGEMALRQLREIQRRPRLHFEKTGRIDRAELLPRRRLEQPRQRGVAGDRRDLPADEPPPLRTGEHLHRDQVPPLADRNIEHVILRRIILREIPLLERIVCELTVDITGEAPVGRHPERHLSVGWSGELLIEHCTRLRLETSFRLRDIEGVSTQFRRSDAFRNPVDRQFVPRIGKPPPAVRKERFIAAVQPLHRDRPEVDGAAARIEPHHEAGKRQRRAGLVLDGELPHLLLPVGGHLQRAPGPFPNGGIGRILPRRHIGDASGDTPLVEKTDPVFPPLPDHALVQKIDLFAERLPIGGGLDDFQSQRIFPVRSLHFGRNLRLKRVSGCRIPGDSRFFERSGIGVPPDLRFRPGEHRCGKQ